MLNKNFFIGTLLTFAMISGSVFAFTIPGNFAEAQCQKQSNEWLHRCGNFESFNTILTPLTRDLIINVISTNTRGDAINEFNYILNNIEDLRTLMISQSRYTDQIKFILDYLQYHIGLVKYQLTMNNCDIYWILQQLYGYTGYNCTGTNTGNLPNLALQNFQYSVTGTQYTFSATIKNIGNATASGYKFALLIDNVQLGSELTMPLPLLPTQLNAQSETVNLANLAPGWHTATFQITPLGSDQLSSDNSMEIMFYVGSTPTPSHSDLEIIGMNINVLPATINRPWVDAELYVNVKNNGTATINYLRSQNSRPFRFYCSDQQNQHNNFQMEFSNFTLSGGEYKEIFSQRLIGNIPTLQTTGFKQFICIIDNADAIVESNESNNGYTLRFTVTNTGAGGQTSQGSGVARIAFWYGKVNQHFNTSTLQRETDPDGISGGSIRTGDTNDYGYRPLEYCRKFYPNSTSVRDYQIEIINDWKSQGNIGSYPGPALMTIQCIQ